MDSAQARLAVLEGHIASSLDGGCNLGVRRVAALAAAGPERPGSQSFAAVPTPLPTWLLACPADPANGLLIRQSTSSIAARSSAGFTRNFPQATTAAVFPASASDALALDSLLTPEERQLRRRVRQFMVCLSVAMEWV